MKKTSATFGATLMTPFPLLSDVDDFLLSGVQPEIRFSSDASLRIGPRLKVRRQSVALSPLQLGRR